jgi:hypothetical protein
MYMSRFSKAFLAEKAIRTVKFQLETALEGRKNDKDNLAQYKWVSLLANIVLHHNKQFCDGTSFRRNEINNANFLSFLDQQDGSGGDVTLKFNSRSIDQHSFASSIWRQKIFAHQVGDKVRLTRSSLKEAKEKKKFDKASKVGTHTRELYTLFQAKLASSKDGGLSPGESIFLQQTELDCDDVLPFSVYSL